jgi:hypothetical protein
VERDAVAAETISTKFDSFERFIRAERGEGCAGRLSVRTSLQSTVRLTSYSQYGSLPLPVEDLHTRFKMLEVLRTCSANANVREVTVLSSGGLFGFSARHATMTEDDTRSTKFAREERRGLLVCQ